MYNTSDKCLGAPLTQVLVIYLIKNTALFFGRTYTDPIAGAAHVDHVQLVLA